MASRTSLPVLWIATTNRGKTREFRSLFGSKWIVRDLHSLPRLPPVRETGKTFMANARIKALALSSALPGKLILADDSGLVVPSLGGRPGVRSARYSGPKATNETNRAKLLHAMRSFSGRLRKAYFQAALVLALNGLVLGTQTGRVWGRITTEERGTGGFGYDPIFRPKGFFGTFGELGARTKRSVSHRSQAARRMEALLSRVRAILRAKN
ncbi:MAG: non-canonical purine NTP pyrophosphatase [Verrucomicrobia bacterium]|nr:non-canonical purine NTP pyrophosphatase [Verrucomicrobiota bacterium]